MHKKHVYVLGCGRIGKTIAIDLSKDYRVTVVDSNKESLQSLPPGMHYIALNILEHMPLMLASIIKEADLVVSALPSSMGHKVLTMIIGLGKKPVVDISFSPEDPFELDLLAKENGVVAAVDCGVDPGLTNFVAASEAEQWHVEELTCYVGGLPLERVLPWQYKAPFAPRDVIEEYTRPARFQIDGQPVTKPALSDRELIHFPGVGTLEAFNTDGLRTLLTTMRGKIPTMRGKTLRYPGHIALFEKLEKAGLFSKEPEKISGITPFDFNSTLLSNAWRLYEGEPEFTALLVQMRGTENHRKKEVTYTLLDRGDPETNTTSMARTTGYTATGIARILLEKLYTHPGITPPELIGKDQRCYEYLMEHLRTRGVMVQKTINTSKKA